MKTVAKLISIPKEVLKDFEKAAKKYYITANQLMVNVLIENRPKGEENDKQN